MGIVSSVIFEEDNNTYVPDTSNYSNGRVRKWKLAPLPPPEVEGQDGLGSALQTMMLGMGDPFIYQGTEGPGNQFVDVLIGRKQRYAASEPVDAAIKITYVIQIELCKCEKDVWRRIRVPSAIVFKLHDQMIVPVMGWSRGYHGYAFQDQNDGSIIGPGKCGGYIAIYEEDFDPF